MLYIDSHYSDMVIYVAKYIDIYYSIYTVRARKCVGGFVWPRAWIGKVRGRRWVPATKRRGKGRYHVARIL